MAKDQRNISLGKLLCKWTGITFVHSRYKAWRTKRRVAELPSTLDPPLATPTLTPPHDDPFDDVELIKMIICAEQPVSTQQTSPYVIQRLLGVGSFSKVKLAVDGRTNETVALKMIPLTDIRASLRLRETLLREIQILRSVDHPNIVRFKEIVIMNDAVCLAMEYVPGVELFQHVSEQRKLDGQEAREILRQVLEALHYLHTQGIVHRDLKLENILIDTSGRRPWVKLIDFGLARKLTETSTPLSTRCGSEEYAAPEIILGQAYDGRLADIWSFGVVMYACLIGYLPFNPDVNNPKALSQRIIQLNYRSPDGLMSSEAAELLLSILVKDPASRIRIPKILSSPFFNPR